MQGILNVVPRPLNSKRHDIITMTLYHHLEVGMKLHPGSARHVLNTLVLLRSPCLLKESRIKKAKA